MTTLIKLKNRGLAEGTLRNTSFDLRHLAKNADLDHPESVKEYIAKKNCANSQKMNLASFFLTRTSLNHILPSFLVEGSSRRRKKREVKLFALSH